MTTLKSPTTEQAGFTLLELMIAVTVGAVVMTAVYAVFSTAVKSERATRQALAPLNSARYAFAVLARDVRNLDPFCEPPDIQCRESSCLFPVAGGDGDRHWVQYEQVQGRFEKTTWPDGEDGPDREKPENVLTVCDGVSRVEFETLSRGASLLPEDSMDKSKVLPGVLELTLHLGQGESRRRVYRSSVLLEITPEQ